MITLKFGGTSMGSAPRILESARIMAERTKEDTISVVVSAVAGVSNRLQEAITECTAGGHASSFVEALRKTHEDICEGIHQQLGAFSCEKVAAKITPVFEELEKLLSALSLFGECPPSVHCRIMGSGEMVCAPIVEEVLHAMGQTVALLDSRQYIFTRGSQSEGEPDYPACREALCSLHVEGNPRILIFPGFVCSWRQTATSPVLPGLLGRNGSDFSASIVATCLHSRRVEFWSDVDGIYTADPRVVKDAILVDDMTYEEAMELSFFGSQVLHPKTLAPLAEQGIEAWSLNSANPSSRGTRIARGPFNREGRGLVCGISCLKDCAMISVSGPCMKGKKGMAARIFTAVGSAGSSLLLITQSSSEYTITFCVRSADSRKVLSSLEAELALEIKAGLLNPPDVRHECAIVSIVGDAMKSRRGVAGTFFDALASRDVNILAIAQGSSERSISAVIAAADGDTALRIAHRFFFNTQQSIEVFAFGAGTIGGTLLDQIDQQQVTLAQQGIDIKVMAIANIDGMIFSAQGIDLATWRQQIKDTGKTTDLDEILAFVKESKPLNPVFVDCTASYDLPEHYIDILRTGMHIVTPNKRANSMSQQFWLQLRDVAREMHVRFLYETNVGAGLPIIDTLQNLFKSGDSLVGFTGIMSGSLSYIFGKLDEGVPFSEAVAQARQLRYTEPDPRDDLKGIDVARKALIIARESGMKLELSDIHMESIFPEGFCLEGSVEDFMAHLHEVDGYFEAMMRELWAQGKVLRMGASIEEGRVTVGLLRVGTDDPLYAVKGGENAFVFRTARYTPIPLTVRGYGAGAGVTAAGVFADILRTARWNSSV